MNTRHTQLPVEIRHHGNPVVRVDSTPDNEVEVKVLRYFDNISLEPGLTFRRKVSSVETAVIFALHWLGLNSSVSVDDFEVVSDI